MRLDLRAFRFPTLRHLAPPLVLAALFAAAAQTEFPMGQGRDVDNILSQRRQAEVYNEILSWRLDNILPQIMRREGIDL